jgi:hypothetical protein
MAPRFRFVPLMLLLCAAACHRGPDTDAANDAAAPPATTPEPAATAPAAPAPATPSPAAGTAYACVDGTRLRASFGDHDATLQWADGRSLVLPRAESASKGGGDAYVGETVSLQRDGTHLQLHDGDRAATTCDPDGAASTSIANDAGAAAAAAGIAAAARYACDANTTLERNDDGSYRAEVPGNPPIRLTRIAGSTPPVYTGASLYLRIGTGGNAILSQGDRTTELHCIAAG